MSQATARSFGPTDPAAPEPFRDLPPYRLVECRVDDVDAENRTVVSVINTESIDRYRTIIVPKGGKLDNFRKNPVVLFNHDDHCPPIGRCLWVKYRKAKNDLIAKTYFEEDEFADGLYRKVLDETLRAWSIRFHPDWSKSGMPTEEEVKARKDLKDCYCMYRAWELLEYSLVVLPGNADCLTLPGERGIEAIRPEVRAYLEHVTPEALAYSRKAAPAPEPKPAPAPEPAPPALPPLRAITKEARVRQIAGRLTSPDMLARLTRDAEDLLRGKV